MKNSAIQNHVFHCKSDFHSQLIQFAILVSFVNNARSFGFSYVTRVHSFSFEMEYISK